MLLGELFENDAEHQKVLDKTGFWGKQGSGCIFLAKDTKRFLLCHRSPYIEQPNSWGNFGGAIDEGENPEQAAIREAHEECGYDGPVEMVPLLVFNAKKNGKVVFRYSNFLAVIPKEFTPRLDWESQGYAWCEFGQWPEPLHFGLKALLSDPASVKTIKSFLNEK